MHGYLAATAFGVALIAAASPASAATVLGASWNTACGKTTCFNDKGVFSQTFSASDFGGRMTIGQLLLERGVLGAFDSRMFRLSFTLNGEEVGTWGSFLMGGIGGNVLSFTGESFVWNPEDGDLVLVLTIAPAARAGAGGFGLSSLDPGFAAPQRQAPDSLFVPAPVDPGFGRGGASARDLPFMTAIPEPTAWALMIGGFGLTGVALRRRREVAG